MYKECARIVQRMCKYCAKNVQGCSRYVQRKYNKECERNMSRSIKTCAKRVQGMNKECARIVQNYVQGICGKNARNGR